MSKSGTEVKYLDYENDIIYCNLCNKPMNYINYEQHYDKCLDIEYLVGIANEKKEDITRKDLEEYEPSTIRKLLDKYKVEGV